MHWYHGIEFADGEVVSGRFGKRLPPNYTLFGVFHFLKYLDVTNMDCLDVGTVDGLVAFILKAYGARTVTATDIHERATFKYALEKTGLEIDYIHPASISDILLKNGGKRYDLVVFAGILYHAIDPIGYIYKCRELVKNNGILLLETSYIHNDPYSRMHFNLNDNSGRQIRQSSVFWRPSLDAVKGMLELSGFRVLAHASSGSRLTVMAQAVPEEKFSSESPLIEDFMISWERNKGYIEDKVWNLNLSDDESNIKIRHDYPDEIYINPALYRDIPPYAAKWDVGWADYLRAVLVFEWMRLGYEKARLISRLRKKFIS